MTALQHIALEAVPPQPWRNGGGSTRELFTWPGGAAPWQLRISVADISQDGPFSAFDGVDRWFAVLQGAGVRLALPGGMQALALHSPPLHFPGEAAPGCWLADGPTRDLNLMLRRGSGQALMLAATPGQPWLDAAPLRGLFSTAALQLQTGAEPPQAVAAWSLVLGSASAQQTWSIDTLPAGARALWLAFSPAAEPA
ncbi:MAG: HutD family protein [Pseudomonadota bacterium]